MILDIIRQFPHIWKMRREILEQMHNVAKNPRWLAKRYPVLDEHGESVWPAQWSKERIEAFIATRREKHGKPRRVAPRGRAPKNLALRERMARTLSTVRGRKVYAQRKAIVEPVFGQIKQARGFRQFLLRGLKHVEWEWALVTTVHNVLKLFTALDLAKAR